MWYNNDSSYKWYSRNEDLKELNLLKLKTNVAKALNSYNEFDKLTVSEKEYANQIITDLIKAYNRDIL